MLKRTEGKECEFVKRRRNGGEEVKVTGTW